MWISPMAEGERYWFARAEDQLLSLLWRAAVLMWSKVLLSEMFSGLMNYFWVMPISGRKFSLQLMERERLINSQAYFHKAKSRVLLAERVWYNQALQASMTAWEMNSLLLLALVQILSMGRDEQKSKADDRSCIVQSHILTSVPPPPALSFSSMLWCGVTEVGNHYSPLTCKSNIEQPFWVQEGSWSEF